MRELVRAWLLVALVASVVAACGGNEPATTPALAPATRPAPGLGRVPDGPAVDCPRERAPGFASGMGRTLCATDADCTEGTNGRCLESHIRGVPVAACSYDQCFVDADCPPRHACVCGRRGPDASGAHGCSPNQCESDADCASGHYCRRSEWGKHCQSLHDECVVGQGCGPGEACMHDPAAGIQRCQVPPPPPPG